MKKEKDSFPIHIVILCCILLTTIISVVSLFLFFCSITPEDLKNAFHYNDIFPEKTSSAPEESSIPETETEESSVPETIAKESSAPKTVSKKPPAAISEQAETEPSVPFSDTLDELGNSSDLEIQDVPENIYFVMVDTAMGPMMYYNQGDRRWADYLYGGEDPMEGYGCGPTAVSMLISSFSIEGGGSTPVDLAEWSFKNGCFASGSGSYHKLIPQALSAYGFSVESVSDLKRQHVSDLLSTGHVLVALMGKGTLTKNGHFILITKLLENGNVRIADPNSYENSRKEWDLNLLLSELKRGAASGGPLWSVQNKPADPPQTEGYKH